MTTFFQYQKKSLGTWLNRLVLLGCVPVLLAACGGGGPGGGNPPPRTPVLLYSKVIGLQKPGLVLQNNNADDLSISADGTYNFATPLHQNDNYHVTVAETPDGQICTPKEGPGIAGASAPTVNVQCSAVTSSFTVGGVVKNLNGGVLQLQNNEAEIFEVAANGESVIPFTFKDPVAAGSRYSVLVLKDPAGQKCTVENPSDEDIDANVTDIVVQCSGIESTHSIGGKVSGLEASNKVTLINNNDTTFDKRLTVSGTGADVGFVFTDRVADLGSYNVAIFEEPATQSCAVIDGSGTGTGVTSNVTSVKVVCSEKLYAVSGVIRGLTPGASVKLLNNKDSEIVTGAAAGGDQPFSFTNRLPKASDSVVTVGAQPNGLVCTVSNYEHLNLSSDVTDIVVVCSDAVKAHNIGYNVTGLLTNGVTAINNGDFSDLNTVTQNDVLSNFKTQLADGGGYDVKIVKMPFLQFCSVGNGSSKNVDRDITTVTVTCVPPVYTTVHAFNSDVDFGVQPKAAVIQDNAGNFYGTTSAGNGSLRGTVYKIAPDGTTTTLHSFVAPGLSTPLAALVLGSDGYLYGTTSEGGVAGVGGVFRLKTSAPAGFEVLHEFTGAAPDMRVAALIEDASNPGTFYGTTSRGGDNNTGTIFKITADKQFTSLFSFTANGLEFGSEPKAALLQVGNVFYGTTWAGGKYGGGAIYRFTPADNKIALMYSLNTPGTNEGSRPLAALVKSRDDGKLYGTTDQGATGLNNATIFSYNPADSTLQTLRTLDYSDTSGDSSYGGLVQGEDGSFYGITRTGAEPHGPSIYRITPDGKNFTVLYSFVAPNTRLFPHSGLMMSSDGNLYGTTTRTSDVDFGGTVFRFGRSQ